MVTSVRIVILNFFNHKIHFCLKYLKSKLTPWTLNHLFWTMASSYSYLHVLLCCKLLWCCECCIYCQFKIHLQHGCSVLSIFVNSMKITVSRVNRFMVSDLINTIVIIKYCTSTKIKFRGSITTNLKVFRKFALAVSNRFAPNYKHFL